MELLLKVIYILTLLGYFNNGQLDGYGEKLGIDIKNENYLNNLQKIIEQPDKSKFKLKITYIEISSPKSSANSSIYTYSFTGEFKLGLRHGYGREETSEYTYTGLYENDHKHGKGKLKYKNKDIYEGYFKNDQFNGEGIYKWENGCSFHGSFFEGKMHGNGTYKWPDGTSYTGDYEDNVKHGFGKFEKTDGGIIEGAFIKGKLKEYTQSKSPNLIKSKVADKFLNLNYNVSKSPTSKSNKENTAASTTFSNIIGSQRGSHSSNSVNNKE